VTKIAREVIDELVQRYEAGERFCTVARNLGIGTTTAWRYLNARGITMRGPRGLSGAEHPFWKGGRKQDKNGYFLLLLPEHHRADPHGYVYEHIVIVERLTGIVTAPPMEIHHVNEIKSDNSPSNLVLCPDRAYHQLLHARARIVRAGGDPNTYRPRRSGADRRSA
jgi:hypothetical protein